MKQLTKPELEKALEGMIEAVKAVDPTITRAPAYVQETEAQRLEKERGAEYGQAWLTSGRIVKMLAEMGLMDRILKSEFAYNWDICMNKMVRLLANPFKVDSWRDIEVYAKLVADYLEARANEHS